MRLIDADKIGFVLPRTLTEEENNTYNLVIKKAFENAPTVKAIPIEWIRRQKMESNLNVIDYALGVIDGHNCCIDMLIRKWEKENEQNKKNTPQID